MNERHFQPDINRTERPGMEALFADELRHCQTQAEAAMHKVAVETVALEIAPIVFGLEEELEETAAEESPSRAPFMARWQQRLPA